MLWAYGSEREKNWRVEELRGLRGIRRIAAQAIHAAGQAYAPVAKKTTGIEPYLDQGLEYIGSGMQSTVLKLGNTVVKIARRPHNLSSDQRVAEAARFDDLIQLNASCHPEETVPTRVVTSFTVPGSRNNMALTQPYIDGVCALTSTPGYVAPDVQAFTERSLDEMASSNGPIPDVIGNQNLVRLTDEKLHLVDTVPLEHNPGRTGVYERNLRRLMELARSRAEK